MRSPDLQHLLQALDQMTASGPSAGLVADCEQAQLRLAALNRRLGATAVASPYLVYLQRAAATVRGEPLTAASA